MQERDFKGVWFPKEVWLNKELDMIEKALLIEIDSLDNEFHCVAGNDYFAEFLGVSESKVTRSIKKLKELGYIEDVHFDGRVRKLRVVNLTRQNKQIDDHNNITNNINNSINTNVLIPQNADDNEEFLNNTPKDTQPKKKGLYANCMVLINDFTEDGDVRECLKEFLNMRIANKDKPFGANSFKGMLKKLRELTTSKAEVIKIIKQATDRCYLTFYPLKKSSYKTGCPELIEQSTNIDISDIEYEEAIELGQKF